MTTPSTADNRITIRGTIIEIPLKPRKKMISLRVDEEALNAIDKFVTFTGEYSRTLLVTKIIEAVAEGLKRTGYNAVSLELKFSVNSVKDSPVSIVIPLRRSRP